MLTTPTRDTRADLVPLTAAIRSAVQRRNGWHETVAEVAGALRRHLPTADVLTAEERRGDPDHYVCHLLHAEPDGSFSIVALVWRPGQMTPVHDHVTWCAFGVVEGVEYEELYAVEQDATGEYLVKVGENANHRGEVSYFTPPGDIHRVRNSGEHTAISLHVYGTDISRIGSSVRRCYDLPIR